MSIRPRQVVALALLLAVVLLLLLAAERAVALAERLAGLPHWLQWSVAAVLAVFIAGAVWLGWLWLRPKRRRPPPVVDRATLDTRIDRLDKLGADTGALRAEVTELDRRRAEAQLYVAVFGEISSGKSSLIAALVPGATVQHDVVGGTTREVAHHRGRLADGHEAMFADVPGSGEVDGDARETLAREEVLRAHVVLYVCDGDLTRRQGEELRWLAAFGKPVVLVLNKADRYDATELSDLVTRLRQLAGKSVDAVVTASAGGVERLQRQLADGRVEKVERPRVADVNAVRRALLRSAGGDFARLEAARERAVLGGLDQRTAALESSARHAEAERIVARYTRRAIVGALAAVVPGSDLVIQGALATAMTRELARLYDARVSDIEIDAFLKQARLTLRTSASIVLAIAGNALKAFPGLGTLGGGVLHAFAYALIFDSLGKALAVTFAEHRSLDQQAAGDALRDLLGQANAERIRQLAALTTDALRRGDGDEDGD
jgi:GTP-binding protein EngB required for normal cell division